MKAITKAARAARLTGLLGGVVLGLAACAPIDRRHGYMPEQGDLDALRLGQDTRASVVETLGSPQASGVVAEGSLYYVSTRIRRQGLRAPEVVGREVVALRFDAAGVLRNVERFTLEDGKVVALSRRVTADPIEDVGLLRQLLGNVGGIRLGDNIGEAPR